MWSSPPLVLIWTNFAKKDGCSSLPKEPADWRTSGMVFTHTMVCMHGNFVDT